MSHLRPIVAGSRPARAVRVLATLLAMGTVASPAARGAEWTTEAASGPPAATESALTGVSCVSAVSCMAVGVSDGGFDGNRVALLDVGAFSERWDGTTWSVVPAAGLAGSGAGLYSVSCATPTFCVAVGQMHSEGRLSLGRHFAYGDDRALVEVWDGVSWSVAAQPAASAPASGLFGVACPSSGFCLAVGSSKDKALAETWNGASWSLQAMPRIAGHSSTLTAASCATADACTAVGSSIVNKHAPFDTDRPLAAQWDGRRWSLQRPPADTARYRGRSFVAPTELTGVSCVSPSSCLAVGNAYDNQQGLASPFAVRRTGRGWVRTTAGLPAHSSLLGVSCAPGIPCVAVGQSVHSWNPPAPSAPLAEAWNGARWSRLSVPRVPAPALPRYQAFDPADPVLAAIACRADAGCRAVGAQGHGADSAALAQSSPDRRR